MAPNITISRFCFVYIDDFKKSLNTIFHRKFAIFVSKKVGYSSFSASTLGLKNSVVVVVFVQL